MYKLLFATILIVGIVFFGSLLQGVALAGTNQTTGASGASEKPPETAAPKKPSETDGSKLSGISFTTGGFLSYLRDDVYVEDSKGKIKKDVQGDFAKSLGTLAHVPLFTFPESENQLLGHGGRLGIGLSGGFGLNGSDIVKNLQIVGGGSIFYKTENALIAFTVGRMVGPVQRLTGNYTAGEDDFPDGNVGLTNTVYEVDKFFALTVSANMEKLSRYFNIDKVFNREETAPTEEKSQTEDNEPPQENTGEQDN